MKRLFCTVIILFLILALLPTVAFAATSDVYVSSTGSDKNPGTEQAPYQTIEKAFETVEDGGTIHIVDTVSVSADFTWPTYSPQAHAGLAEMYVMDERFTVYYDGRVAGCAVFLRDAIKGYCSR